MLLALASAKQNADYRISCDNEQPGIEATCRDLIKEYNLPITYETLNSYYAQNTTKRNDAGNSHNKDPFNDDIAISIKYGSISFEAFGNPQTVLSQLESFSNNLLPRISKSLPLQNLETSKRSKQTKRKR